MTAEKFVVLCTRTDNGSLNPEVLGPFETSDDAEAFAVDGAYPDCVHVVRQIIDPEAAD